MSAKVRFFAVVGAWLAVLSAALFAQQATVRPVDTYDELFQRYLLEARTARPVSSDVPAWGWMSGLALDRRARNVNDLITIRVVENITGSGTADSALGKNSSAGVGVPNILGIEKKLPGAVDPSNLVSANGKTDFKGSGSTNRAGTLTAQLTARVSDVLPNGDLVVEGVREIEINGDRQIVVLTGVVRTADVAPSNEVLSTVIGQLRIRYFGRGLMKDNLKPGFLVRLLNKVF
ncbi:MAG: flagellar basal body L-ring protein FlgH [Vicinamibacterales bacterium]